ncbi:MAG: DUF2461 domain-containing protein [Desulfarculaceae bacterium]|nr:DUF2461 domain-containing protein [Desulfarculaceae bacterium]MCF8048122.1 DUF2461 domain-containing protein [Desulfarculaceae bacterium]MCF8064757.1 DUF2461 domain-containing protein [Desulfarculaceae bacterium]MCF8123090.1 DUF2461 domain-containing protein [Desulfarculaceae bacterium]
MAEAEKFQGFTPQTVKFFNDLKKHNSKAWFQERKPLYDSEVLAPSRALVTAMGQRLAKIAPLVNADPKVNKSLFRIYRDVRFSKDKSPYKTHMGLWWWEGPGPRMECSGFYFQLDPPKVMLGVGMYCFPKFLLAPYRQAVADDKLGKALERAVKKVSKAGYSVGGLKYKRVPRGFDPEHPRGELLRHDGLWASYEADIPPEFYTADLPAWCLPHFRAMLPLHQWLLELTVREFI